MKEKIKQYFQVFRMLIICWLYWYSGFFFRFQYQIISNINLIRLWICFDVLVKSRCLFWEGPCREIVLWEVQTIISFTVYKKKQTFSMLRMSVENFGDLCNFFLNVNIKFIHSAKRVGESAASIFIHFDCKGVYLCLTRSGLRGGL